MELAVFPSKPGNSIERWPCSFAFFSCFFCFLGRRRHRGYHVAHVSEKERDRLIKGFLVMHAGQGTYVTHRSVSLPFIQLMATK